MFLLRVVSSQFRANIRNYSTGQRVAHEVSIPVPWGSIRGKWWEPTNTRPILAIHGWQDNSGSFDRLIPLLTDKVGFLAIDLPGHGYSSKLPRGAHYHNLNYPILIQRIANYFNWDKVTLMGHSMGGISCYTYTMIFPKRVDFLISIDGLKPLTAKDNIYQINKGMDEQIKYDELASDPREPPSYTLEEIHQKVADALAKSIDIEQAHFIAERNIAESKLNPGKYYFARDPRLKSSLTMNWPHNELLEGAGRVTCPILMFKFSKSGYFEQREALEEVVKIVKAVSVDFNYEYVEGKHHTHLNNPEAISGAINKFILKQLEKEDRQLSGVKDIVFYRENK